jgi:hypothetical protein
LSSSLLLCLKGSSLSKLFLAFTKRFSSPFKKDFRGSSRSLGNLMSVISVVYTIEPLLSNLIGLNKRLPDLEYMTNSPHIIVITNEIIIGKLKLPPIIERPNQVGIKTKPNPEIKPAFA